MLTNDQIPHHLEAFPLLPASALPECRSILQHPTAILVGLLVLDVVTLTPARGLEAGDEEATPEREVVAVDRIAGAAARGLEGAEGNVRVDAFGDALDGLRAWSAGSCRRLQHRLGDLDVPTP